ncbi:hypothetical protein [Vibrio ziniensis]|uniref:Uncharacterized protein n=1 Tax=Vibrio ziniensis TaxID=2711221 RepID=A0A6G7CLN9_9VIBR|nr:hypothetical protein [Vibrio ziniensis]QIH42994.1 hypothetical protein G5S32_14025 [Vibrio ziniensis]
MERVAVNLSGALIKKTFPLWFAYAKAKVFAAKLKQQEAKDSKFGAPAIVNQYLEQFVGNSQ